MKFKQYSFGKKLLFSLIAIIIILSSTALIYYSVTSFRNYNNEEEIVDQTFMPKDTIFEYGLPISEYDIEEGKIGRGEFFSTLMERLGVTQKDAYTLSEIAKRKFDLRQIKVGYSYHAFYTKDEERSLAYLVYEKDKRSYVLFSLKDSMYVDVHEKDIKTVINFAEVTINTSLWEDVKASGAPMLLAMKLSDVIYAWSIDFFGLQKGDSFKAIYEVVEYKGEILSVENVLYSIFTHDGKDYEALYYDEEGSSNLYWNEKGESMKKAFLKAPLSFTRISSGYSLARRHPVTRIVRPHTGIDYAAPSGTPVMSIGDGVVVYKGYKRAEGNMVKIKHNSTYSSAYLHLSKYGKNIGVGSRVSQGQIIGYVGSTGSSTGPHLDFRIWKGGSPVNPLKMVSPPIAPIAKKNLDNFYLELEQLRGLKDKFIAQDVYKEMVENLQ